MKHPKDTMTHERRMELDNDYELVLTEEEIANGYVFCCEWDGLTLHASHPEANCCECLKEFRKANNIPEKVDYGESQDN